jgi:hypothetical protein
MNTPKDPIIIWKLKNIPAFQLEPGTNRFIGSALRKDQWLSALLITDDPSIITPADIQLGALIETTDLVLTSYEIEKKLPEHVWGMDGRTTVGDGSWYRPAFSWTRRKLKYAWALEFQNQQYLLNPFYKFLYFKYPRKIKEVVRVEDHKDVQAAVQYLFNRVVTVESLINEH